MISAMGRLIRSDNSVNGKGESPESEALQPHCTRHPRDNARVRGERLAYGVDDHVAGIDIGVFPEIGDQHQRAATLQGRLKVLSQECRFPGTARRRQEQSRPRHTRSRIARQFIGQLRRKLHAPEDTFGYVHQCTFS